VSAPGLRVLDRYVLRELLGPFFLALVLFTFFFLIDRIYLLADLVITTGVPLPLVLQLVVYMLPSFVALSCPWPCWWPCSWPEGAWPAISRSSPARPRASGSAVSCARF
jgi:hypothetical protein